MIIADSHEFVELYRGTKDLRLGMELAERYPDTRVVAFAPERLSPTDRERFGCSKLQEVGLPPLPGGMELRLLPGPSIRFAQKESGGVMSFMRGYVRSLLSLRPNVVLENPYSWLTPRSYQTRLAADLMGVPVVYHDPGDDIPISARQRVMALWEGPVIRRAAAIITFNEAGCARFVRKYGCNPDRISVVPKPVDAAVWSCSEESRDVVRHRWGIESGAVVVAYSGRLAAYKGSRVLLRVARAALKDSTLSMLRFVFIGGTVASSESAKDYALPNTHVTGMVAHDEMPQALAACDIVVFPDITHPGGFPTTVAEAMASGRAIIAGLGHRTDLLPLQHEVNALIVQPGRVDEIMAGIRRLVDQPLTRSRLALEVRSYAEKEMDYSVVARRYMDVLRGVVR